VVSHCSFGADNNAKMVCFFGNRLGWFFVGCIGIVY